MPFLEVLSNACMENPRNEAITRMERDQPAVRRISEYITGELGQRLLINLSTSYDRSRIALAMYAGDGLVVKINPVDYSDKLGSVPLLLPSISRRRIEGNVGDFIVKTYPWLRPSSVSRSEIEAMKGRIARYGLRFNEGDDKPSNIHHLPDAGGTLVGIDSDMFGLLPGEQLGDGDVNQWLEVIKNLFPIYRNGGEIPKQTEKTLFDFVSMCDLGRAKEKAQKQDPPSAPGSFLGDLFSCLLSTSMPKTRKKI